MTILRLFWMLIRYAVFEIVSGYGGVGLSLGLPYVSCLERSNRSWYVNDDS